MAKKILLISLVCIGMMAFMASQASAGCITLAGGYRFCAWYIPGSVTAELTCEDVDLCGSKETEITLYGLPENDCQLTGTLYCRPVDGNGEELVQALNSNNDVEECKNGQRKGHIKWELGELKGKGKGHEKGKGKGHTGTCLVEPETTIPASESTLKAEGSFDCEGGECTDVLSVEISYTAGQDACYDAFGPGFEFDSFVPDAFIARAAATEVGEIADECTLSPGGNGYDCVEYTGDFPPCGPDPECVGETCGEGFPTPCNQPQPEGGCLNAVCVTTAEELGFCVEGATPCSGLGDCETSADCEEGEVCAVETCCVRNVCVPEEAFCPPADDSPSPEVFEAAALKAGTTEGGPTIGGCK